MKFLHFINARVDAVPGVSCHWSSRSLRWGKRGLSVLDCESLGCGEPWRSRPPCIAKLWRLAETKSCKLRRDDGTPSNVRGSF